MRVLGLSGSLRKGSSNTALLQVAKAVAPDSVDLEIYTGLGELPHFNPDLDNDTPPPSVVALRQALASSDALLISTPEYAHGIPGVLKNALDWLVRDTDFVGKRVGILFGSATEGSFAQAALVEVLNTMSTRVIPEAVVNIAGARVKFAPDGTLLDQKITSVLRKIVESLTAAQV